MLAEVVTENGTIPVEGHEIKELPKVMTAEEIDAALAELGKELRRLIVSTKRLPRTGGLEAHQDPSRALALAQSHLQTGFMWMRRAVAPKDEF